MRRCSTQDLLLDYAPPPFLRRSSYERRPSHSPSASSLFSRSGGGGGVFDEERASPARHGWTTPELRNSAGRYEPPSPNYSRYSSVLDDKHNWGFSTLRRRNSTISSSRSQDRF